MTNRRESVRTWIAASTSELGLSPQAFALVNITRWQALLSDIDDRFFDRSSRGGAIDRADRLQEPYLARCRRTDAFDVALAILPPEERVWLIAEDGGKDWLYDVERSVLRAVLENAAGFEFNVVGRKLDWIVCTNHSDFVFARGQAPEDALRALPPSIQPQ